MIVFSAKKFLRSRMPLKLLEFRRAILKKRLRNYFLTLNITHQNPEILPIIEYYKENDYSVFPYAYTKKYYSLAQDIKIYEDASCKMRYVIHKNKQLYFPNNLNCEDTRNYYAGLLMEQDEDSPHRYETDKFTVKKGDIIADMGTAEGFWALENAEKSGKIYLFECDNYWIQALQETFKPWKEKTVIINKYISDTTKGNNIALDDFLNGNPINFIKADIEGAEILLLKGAKKTLAAQNNLKLILCSYHEKNDEKILTKFLKEMGYNTEHSKGYMTFFTDRNSKTPYLRRGIIRAVKHNREIQ